MKNSLIKFLPIAAAVMLATSCSKDDNDNAPATQSGRDGVGTVTANTIPFSIRVNTGHSLKKVGYAESTNEEEKGWYNISFSDNDVAKLKMIIKEGNTQIGEATLDDAKTATFSGGLTQQPSSNADLTAEISVSGSKNSSDESLADLLANCAHNFSGTFKYGAAEVTLTDQNAYLDITYRESDKIDINSSEITVTDSRVWVAVPAKNAVTSQALGISKAADEVKPGTIYTVVRNFTPKAFSVSPTKKVYFSSGNLQYNPKQNQWQFAAHQYDICHASDEYVVDYYGNWTNKWTDLFGWVGTSSTVAGAAIYGVNTSTSSDGYGNEDGEALKSDWGKVFGENSNWYTLTTVEFQYLFSSNDTRANKYGVAQVAEVQGLVILPDDWTDPKPDGKEFKSGVADDNGSDFYATKNTYSAEDWAKMEDNGAVFLPAAGYREGTQIDDVGDLGDYWSSSADGDYYSASALIFGSDEVCHGNAGRYYGQSVRLVRTAL